jgi:hypothetical protein
MFADDFGLGQLASAQRWRQVPITSRVPTQRDPKTVMRRGELAELTVVGLLDFESSRYLIQRFSCQF